MKWDKGQYWITDDTSNINLDFVVASLNSTYWAGDRPRATIAKSISNSTFLSLFDGDRQIGFNRIVTDNATFAWLCDLWIDPDYRGSGLGKWLFECTLEHPAARQRLVLLSTKDAHGLYEKYGFQRKECMRLRNDPEHAATDRKERQ